MQLVLSTAMELINLERARYITSQYVFSRLNLYDKNLLLDNERTILNVSSACFFGYWQIFL